MTHKYPAVLPPQAIEAIELAVEAHRHALVEAYVNVEKYKRQADEMSERLNREREAHERTHENAIAEYEKLLTSKRQLQMALTEAERRIERMTPDDYESPEQLIREIIDENNLFTYQSAERGFLLREILSLDNLLSSEFAARIRLVLDTPEDAEKRGKAERRLTESGVRG